MVLKDVITALAHADPAHPALEHDRLDFHRDGRVTGREEIDRNLRGNFHSKREPFYVCWCAHEEQFEWGTCRGKKSQRWRCSSSGKNLKFVWGK